MTFEGGNAVFGAVLRFYRCVAGRSERSERYLWGGRGGERYGFG